MRVIKRKPLIDFLRGHADAREQIEAWYREARHAAWRTPHDVRSSYPKASILKGGRVVFDIVGGSYRLVVKIRYAKARSEGIVFIRFIGTHEEYDHIDAETI